MFELLCEDMDADYRRLLLHTEVRWLSKGKALSRVFELREQLQKFLCDRCSPLAEHFSDELALKTRIFERHVHVPE